MNETVIANWNRVVGPEDIVFHPGVLSRRFCRMGKHTEQSERENIPYFRHPRHKEPEAELHEILRAYSDADVYRGRQAGDLSESLSVPLLWRLIW